MTEQAKLALINFTGLVSTAIARHENGKDVDWREIADAQEELVNAFGSAETVAEGTPTLLACPFCGALGEMEIDSTLHCIFAKTYRVRCLRCAVTHGWHFTAQEAARLWNLRPPNAQPPPPGDTP